MCKTVIFSSAIVLMSKISRGVFNYSKTLEISGYMSVKIVQRVRLKEDEFYA